MCDSRAVSICKFMSFTLIAWETPAGAATPADRAAADALLDQSRGVPRLLRPRFRTFGERLHERFPPTGDDLKYNDAWTDGSEGGDTLEPVLAFGLNARGDHFMAAYEHAVVQARRLGLNVYDPQSGDHHLADGRCLPPRSTPIDEFTADVAWRASNWGGAVFELRQGVADGSREALHDLAQCLRHGLGAPRHLLLAGAVMQIAAATDDARRRQRLATLRLLPVDLRDRQVAMRDRLRAEPDILIAIDQELAITTQQRGRLERLRWDPALCTPEDWWSLRLQALIGDVRSAIRLWWALRPSALSPARPPWLPEPLAHQRHLRQAAAWEHTLGSALAEGLLSGHEGWPVDPVEALLWMRRAQAAGESGLKEPIERLSRRLAQGWDAARDRAVAEPMLRDAVGLSGEPRVCLLRRACELDHPEGWRLLGDAYLRGEHGLPQDRIVGAALVLAAQKVLSRSSGMLGDAKPASLSGIGGFDIDDALRLCGQLLAEPDPWGTIARYRNWLDDTPVLVVA